MRNNPRDTAKVAAVHLSAAHSFSKRSVGSIRLVAGLGVEGDAHSGALVQHRSRVARDPSQPNLRQVHLVHAELLAELVTQGFPVQPGSIGENITTSGIALLALSQGTELHIGSDAVVVVTGLRNPCAQLDSFSAGLMGAVLDRTPDGRLIRKSGVMGIVRVSGTVLPGDTIRVVVPAGVALPLLPV
jgi:MOSC domain-containing protein YiiM